MKTININYKNYQKELKKIKNPPEILYLEGNKELLYTNIISIVGTRKCSEYGINTTKKFVKELVKQNITIASGLAIRNRHNSTYCHIRE